MCSEPGRARLSCLRTEAIFEEMARLLGQPLASSQDTGPGWGLHRLRGGALTRGAEVDTSPRCCWPSSRHGSGPSQLSAVDSCHRGSIGC